jgi:CDP-glucose 4,6-dehydratase
VSSWPHTDARVVTARAGNVIGGGDWSPGRLVPDLVRAWTAGETALLRMPGAVRPWQHVLQPLHGYLVYAERLAAGDDLPRALNFGPDDSQAVTVGELVDYAAATWRGRGGSLPEPPARTVPMPDIAETGHLEIDSTLAATTLGWRNVVDWRTATEWTVDWYRRSPTEGAIAVMGEQLDTYEKGVRAGG